MNKFLVVSLLLGIAVLVLGNAFWLLFANDLQTEHLLTDSPFHIILSFLYSILTLGLYFATLLAFSFFVKKPLFWFLFSALSCVSFLFIVGISIVSLSGEVVLSLAMYFFLASYHAMDVLVKNKTSPLAKAGVSLSGVSLIVSIVIVFTFYNYYSHILSQTNTVLSEQIMLKSFSPVLRVYIDDLKITNLNEDFASYLKRRSAATGTSEVILQDRVLKRLDLTQIDSSEKMRNVLSRSIGNILSGIIDHYQKQIPILISLGLGIITQTMITASILLSNLFLFFYLKVMRQHKLIETKKHEVDVEEYRSYEDIG